MRFQSSIFPCQPQLLLSADELFKQLVKPFDISDSVPEIILNKAK